MVKISLPVAVDTNYLLRLAEGDDDAWDALEILATRLKQHVRIATITVLEELAHHAASHSNPSLAEKARRALHALQGEWGFAPNGQQFPLRHDQLEALARDLIRHGVLPEAERNDARILAEAAFAKAFLLVSEDSHFEGLLHLQEGDKGTTGRR